MGEPAPTGMGAHTWLGISPPTWEYRLHGNWSPVCLLLLFYTLGGFFPGIFGEFSRIRWISVDAAWSLGAVEPDSRPLGLRVAYGVALGGSPKPSDTSVPHLQNGPLCGFGSSKLVLRATWTSGLAGAAWRRPSQPEPFAEEPSVMEDAAPSLLERTGQPSASCWLLPSRGAPPLPYGRPCFLGFCGRWAAPPEARVSGPVSSVSSFCCREA